MKLENLHALYVSELNALYNAENQLLKALPKMANRASASELQDAFCEHLEQTRGHVKRLEQIFKRLDTSPEGPECKAMEGLINDAKDVAQEGADPAVRDTALIGAAQRVRHYEIAGYGCVRTYAHLLGFEDDAQLLGETLTEEAAADEKLTAIAESVVNHESIIGRHNGAVAAAQP